MGENIHEGHRQRVRNRYLKEGGSAFENHQLLELILFSCIPMKDTNELAHNLLREFGSLSMLLEADPRDIMRRCKITEKVAVFLSAQYELMKRCYNEKWEEKPVLDSSPLVGEYTISLLKYTKYERFYVICLDSQNRLINSVMIAEGTVDEATVYIRKVVEAVLQHQASSVILAHNHPGGSLDPTEEDVATTNRIVMALNLIEVTVMDHIIVADNLYFSFAENEMIKNKNMKEF